MKRDNIIISEETEGKSKMRDERVRIVGDQRELERQV
jgi:hypothetical protein